MFESRTDIVRRLAEFAVDITENPAKLPAPVAAQCRDIMLNAAAAALAGAAHPDAITLGRFVREMGGNGRCTIIGMGMRTSPVYASLVNGSLVRILDFDDQTMGTGCHATAAVFPTVMALGEMYGFSGASALGAFAAGCEIAARLSATPDLAGSAEPMGSAAAGAALLGLDVAGVCNAMTLASSRSHGGGGYSGPALDSLASGGRVAMEGAVAALLAMEGLGVPGDYASSTGHPDFGESLPASMRGLGERWWLTNPGVGIRLYPCHPAGHCIIDAVLGVVQLHRIQPDQIRDVHVGVTQNTLAELPHAIPADAWQARSCAGFIAAATLCHGQPLINFFSEPAINDAGVRTMMERVSVEASLAPSPLSENPAEVRVTLLDGTSLQHRADHARGTPALPLDADELEAKFLYCTRYILPADHIDEAVSSFRNIEAIENVTGMVSVLGG